LESLLESTIRLLRWLIARAVFGVVVLIGAGIAANKLVGSAITMTGADASQFGGIEYDRVWVVLWVCMTLFAVLAYRPFFSWVDRQPADELAFTRRAAPDFARGALIAMLMLGLPVLILAFTGWFSSTLPSFHRLMMAVVFAIHVAVMEEIFFRGFVLQLLLKFCHPILATLVVAALFMVAHTPDGRDSISLVSVFLTGMAMTVAYFLTRSLWMPIGLHFGWDVILFLLKEQGDSRLASLPTSYFQVPLYVAEILALVAMIGVVTYRAMNPPPASDEPPISSPR